MVILVLACWSALAGAFAETVIQRYDDNDLESMQSIIGMLLRVRSFMLVVNGTMW